MYRLAIFMAAYYFIPPTITLICYHYIPNADLATILSSISLIMLSTALAAAKPTLYPQDRLIVTVLLIYTTIGIFALFLFAFPEVGPMKVVLEDMKYHVLLALFALFLAGEAWLVFIMTATNTADNLDLGYLKILHGFLEGSYEFIWGVIGAFILLLGNLVLGVGKMAKVISEVGLKVTEFFFDIGGRLSRIILGSSSHENEAAPNLMEASLPPPYSLLQNTHQSTLSISTQTKL